MHCTHLAGDLRVEYTALSNSKLSKQGFQDMAVHYPRRTSTIKRARSIGFRARMKTKNGRKIIARQRRIGRNIN